MRVLETLSNKGNFLSEGETFILQHKGRYYELQKGGIEKGNKFVVQKSNGDLSILDAFEVDNKNNIIVADNKFPYQLSSCYRLLTSMNKQEYNEEYGQ